MAKVTTKAATHDLTTETPGWGFRSCFIQYPDAHAVFDGIVGLLADPPVRFAVRDVFDVGSVLVGLPYEEMVISLADVLDGKVTGGPIEVYYALACEPGDPAEDAFIAAAGGEHTGS